MDANAIVSALEKLSGNLVATPLIGALRLPGISCPVDLRVKPENLQIGSGIWFRGAMHELAQHFGSCKGIVVAGSARRAYGGICAAALQRVPAIAVVPAASMTPEFESLFASQDADLVVVPEGEDVDTRADAVGRERGYQRMGGLDAPRYAAGIATVGLELARELPFDTASVFVSPPVLAGPIEAGLRAGNRGCAVHGIHEDELSGLTDLIEKMRIGARLAVDAAGAAALYAALHRSAGPSPCVVISS